MRNEMVSILGNVKYLLETRMNLKRTFKELDKLIQWR